VNFIQYTGITYVMVAANNGLPDIMKCLLDAGANPNTPDSVSLDALLFLCFQIFAFRGLA
jgi:ankyrin repeat protein